MYDTLKLIHVSAVVLSAIGFSARYVLAVRGRMPRHVVARVAPHVVDTVLLASALGLVWIGRFNVLETHWLSAKIIGLMLYIVAGSFALRRAQSQAGRTLAFVIALAIFVWIVSVATTKSPWGMLAGGLQ